jgi:drug/metabolite transporter (DMT)-like permease
METLDNSTSAAPEGATAGGTIAGVFVTLVAAAVLAYSMVVQRHALAHADTSGSKRVPLLPRLECCRVPRLVGWLMGLFLYGVASGLKIVGFNLGPFTVLASVFTTLLVFNLGFAHWLLGETITRDKVASSCLVLLGAVISTAGTPSGVPTQFTPAEIESLLDNGGRIYLGSALTVIAASLVLIVFFEVRHRGAATKAAAP